MKSNCTLTPVKRNLLLILFFLAGAHAYAQPDYDFRNPILISGTALQVNSVYLFKNVKPGVDATVTVTDITGTIFLSDIDGPSGYTEALQPILQVPAHGSGYAEFEVNFLIAGTSTPMIQTEIPATPIDVDGQNYGDGIVKEFDQLELINGYVNYDMLGGELNMNMSGGWVTGNNVAGVDYPGVDTTPRQVMFTIVNSGISKFTFRSGANSTSNAQRQRLRSVYFKKFQYANAFLAAPSLLSFSGNTKNEKNVLRWQTAANSRFVQIEVEKSLDRRTFSSLATISSASAGTSFTDETINSGTVYYRLKMTNADNTIQYSNILTFHAPGSSQQSFKLYPSVVADNAIISIKADKNEQTDLQVFDSNGRLVYRQHLVVTAGTNTFSVNGLGALRKGNYVAALAGNNAWQTQKIILQ